MRDLQNLEIRFAYAMPIAASVPFLWFLGFVAEHFSSDEIYTRGAPLFLTFLVTVLAPILVYSMLGLVSFFAANRNSRILTTLLWILLFPAWYVSALLAIIMSFSDGLYSLLFYGPAPLVASVAAFVSTASRIKGRPVAQTSSPPPI